MPRATEGVGEDDVRPGVHEALMQQLDAVGVVDIPELRRIAGDKSHLEEVAAGGAIGQQATATGEKIGKSVVHGVVH